MPVENERTTRPRAPPALRQTAKASRQRERFQRHCLCLLTRHFARAGYSTAENLARDCQFFFTNEQMHTQSTTGRHGQSIGRCPFPAHPAPPPSLRFSEPGFWGTDIPPARPATAVNADEPPTAIL